MRGKQTATDYDPYLHGITPADAGKTGLIKSPCKSGWDHPRGCGENAEREHYYRHQPGSPPRMRGKQSIIRFGRQTTRITPADAGKTALLFEPDSPKGDHPRGCGENPFLSLSLGIPKGSPPRMRGKLPEAGIKVINIRITPADAGKTVLWHFLFIH